MQETIVRFLDDLDKTEDVVETIEFGLRNKRYVIDLNEKNVLALEQSLEDFIAAARPAPTAITAGSTSKAKRATIGGSVRAAREQTQAIREWARNHGHTVSERGRIPKSIQEAFEAAH